MIPTIASFIPAAALVAMGVLFAWVERRAQATRDFLPAALRDFATLRSRRRTRIAALLIFVGVLMGCGNLTDPKLHPVSYVSIWSLTAVLAISMLCYGIADFYQSRKLWAARTRRSAAQLVEAAKAAYAAESDAAPIGDADSASGEKPSQHGDS